MKLNVYSVYDQAATAYLPPFYMHRDQQALRTFKNCVENPEHAFNHNPADYTLFLIGTFDDERAALEPLTPISLGNGIEFTVALPYHIDQEQSKNALGS